MKLKLLLPLLALILMPCLQVFAGNGAQLFKTNCSSCHTIGRGKLVGPDLKGVQYRHNMAWLIKWIHSSRTFVNSGDKTAIKISSDFNGLAMPDASLSYSQIRSVIAFIKSGVTTPRTATQMASVKKPTPDKMFSYIDDHGNLKYFDYKKIERLEHRSDEVQSVPVMATHVVFVMEENYAYSEIIGSSYAPTLTALSKDSTTVNFTADYAITHPSEPNYLDLFSGYDQTVTTDLSGPASNAPFNDCNLGSSLIAKGYTFTGYAESQPSVGFISTDSPPFYTKHVPWINWVGGTSDTIPKNSDLPFAGYFPDSNNYNTLPTVAWVIPNINDDMHDPATASVAISNGDAWFKTNIMPLVRWAANPVNKTLVIVVWDEDDGSHGNNIPLLFCSGMVNGGNNSTTVSHYDVLRTIEDMYGLSFCGSSATANDVPVTIWRIPTGISTVTAAPVDKIQAWPIPAIEQLNIRIVSSEDNKADISMYDISGKMVKEIDANLKAGDTYFTINTEGFSKGVYFIYVKGEQINVWKKVIVGR